MKIDSVTKSYLTDYCSSNWTKNKLEELYNQKYPISDILSLNNHSLRWLQENDCFVAFKENYNPIWHKEKYETEKGESDLSYLSTVMMSKYYNPKYFVRNPFSSNFSETLRHFKTTLRTHIWFFVLSNDGSSQLSVTSKQPRGKVIKTFRV